MMDDATPANAYRALNFPVLILRGERTLMPTRLIAEGLLDLLPTPRLMVIGAGHMGPLTHTAEVCALIKGHIADADERCAARTLAPRPETIELSGSSALSFAAVHQSVFATSAGR